MNGTNITKCCSERSNDPTTTLFFEILRSINRVQWYIEVNFYTVYKSTFFKRIIEKEKNDLYHRRETTSKEHVKKQKIRRTMNPVLCERYILHNIVISNTLEQKLFSETKRIWYKSIFSILLPALTADKRYQA